MIVNANLLTSLYKNQAFLFGHSVNSNVDKTNICNNTDDAANKYTIIKHTLCKVINPILASLCAYNNKLQNVLNNQSNYALQEQYFNNTNKLIETLRKQRNRFLGNKDANEHIDKLKKQIKTLNRLLYNHYLTLYTELNAELIKLNTTDEANKQVELIKLNKIDEAIKNAERLHVDHADSNALIDLIKIWYGQIKADHIKYRTEFYNKYKQYGSLFGGGENKTRRSKTNGKRKTRKI
jgi:hypothetical protein